MIVAPRIQRGGATLHCFLGDAMMNRFMTLTFVAVVTLVPSLARAQPNAVTTTQPHAREYAAAHPHIQLQQQLDPVEVHRMPLKAFLNHMRELAGVTMVIRWVELNRIGVYSDSPVTLTLESSTIGEAMRQGLRLADTDAKGATFVIRNNEIIVSSMADLARDAEVRVFDIRPLLNAPLSEKDQLRIEESIASLWKQHYQVFSPPWQRLPRRWGREWRSPALRDRQLTPRERETRDTIMQLEDALSKDRAEKLKHLIRTTIDPTSWRDTDLATIEIMGDRLVVRQTRENLGAIDDLLRKLGGENCHPEGPSSPTVQ